MITINRVNQLRANPDNLTIDLSDDNLKKLDNDTRGLYIVLRQFENTFISYKISEVIGFTGMSKENIIRYIEQLDQEGIINKKTLKLKYNMGVEIL
ncbi:MAG: hypothetical protein ACOCRO_10560 [Halanaerobiales bacterium]